MSAQTDGETGLQPAHSTPHQASGCGGGPSGKRVAAADGSNGQTWADGLAAKRRKGNAGKAVQDYEGVTARMHNGNDPDTVDLTKDMGNDSAGDDRNGDAGEEVGKRAEGSKGKERMGLDTPSHTEELSMCGTPATETRCGDSPCASPPPLVHVRRPRRRREKSLRLGEPHCAAECLLRIKSLRTGDSSAADSDEEEGAESGGRQGSGHAQEQNSEEEAELAATPPPFAPNKAPLHAGLPELGCSTPSVHREAESDTGVLYLTRLVARSVSPGSQSGGGSAGDRETETERACEGPPTENNNTTARRITNPCLAPLPPPHTPPVHDPAPAEVTTGTGHKGVKCSAPDTQRAPETDKEDAGKKKGRRGEGAQHRVRGEGAQHLHHAAAVRAKWSTSITGASAAKDLIAELKRVGDPSIVEVLGVCPRH